LIYWRNTEHAGTKSQSDDLLQRDYRRHRTHVGQNQIVVDRLDHHKVEVDRVHVLQKDACQTTSNLEKTIISHRTCLFCKFSLE